MNLYRLTRYLPILPAVYVLFFARRILHFVRLNVNTWYGFLLSLIPAVVVYLLSGSIFSMGFVTVMYFTGISVLFDLAVWIIRKLFSGRMESKPYQVISELQRSGFALSAHYRTNITGRNSVIYALDNKKRQEQRIMKYEISPFASDEEKLLEISETLESIKDALAEVVFDMEDDGKDVSTLDDAKAAL